jgi:phosphocarrier protein HPr
MSGGSYHTDAWDALPAPGEPDPRAAAPRPTGEAMSGETLTRRVVITNPQGLHMRPATAFAQLASQFDCTVTVARGSLPADGKSVLSLLLLVAEAGTELEVTVSGRDAAQALPRLADLLGAPDCGDPPDPAPPPKG